MELTNAKKELNKMEESFNALMLEKEKEIEKVIEKINVLEDDATKQGGTEKQLPNRTPNKS